MGQLGQGSNATIRLKGDVIQFPKETFDTSVLATFEDGNVQANISTEDGLTFILDGYTKLKAHIDNGILQGVGIFEGVPISIEAYNIDGNAGLFDGYVDLASGAAIDEDKREIIAPLKKKSGLNILSDRLEALDYGQLYEEGIITDSDFVTVDYVVEKPMTAIDALTSGIILFQLVKQIAETVQLLADQIAVTSGISSSSFDGSGTIGGVIYNIIKIAAITAYLAALLSVVLRLGRDLVNTFVPPKRQHKAIPLGTLLEKAAQKLGYGFNTTIKGLQNITYLPANLNTDQSVTSAFLDIVGSIEIGIPNASDYGYSCGQIFEIAVRLFNARYTLSGSTIQMHTELSPYWQKQSSYIKPDTLPTAYRLNTDELKGSININFRTDIVDVYTIQNFTGTVYQNITTAKTVQNEDAVSIKGLDEISIPLALGNRKDKLNPFEELLKSIGNTFDQVARILGGSSNISGRIQSKVGVLKVSDNNHSVPKLLWLQGGKIPQNHRALFSAKTLWESYHFERSFIQNNFRRQRKIFQGVRVPFGFNNFVQLTENSYFYTTDGKKGKALRIEWQFLRDYAVMDYYIEEQYTNNLTETQIEP